MTRAEFVAAVLENAAGVREYKLGYDGQNPQGWCDCIGLDIGAFQILGVRWPGTHGTNWTVRYYTEGLSPIKSVGELRAGDVVYKKRSPGEEYYNLPAAYEDHPDKNDYYHIGTVTEVNPLRITHCTDVPGGIRTDSTLGKWSYKGTLKAIDEGGQPIMYEALVIADQGKTVNLREQPSKAARVLVQVPIGDVVDVINEGSEWCQVSYKEYNGYMMTMYTVPISGDAPPEDQEPGQTEPAEPGEGLVTIQMPADMAVALWQALDSVVGHG